MFGGQTVVWDECLDAGSGGNVSNQMAKSLGGTPIEPAAVQVEDRLTRSDRSGSAPKTGYSADRVGLEGHTRRCDHPAHYSVKWYACASTLKSALVRFHHRTHRGHRGLVLWRNGMSCKIS